MVPCLPAIQMSRLRIKTLTSSLCKQVRDKVVLLECKCDFTWQKSKKESSFGVKRKRAGEPCCRVIRASGNIHITRIPCILLQWNKEETVALPETLPVMCFVFFAYLIPAAQSVRLPSFAVLRWFISALWTVQHLLPFLLNQVSFECSIFSSQASICSVETRVCAVCCQEKVLLGINKSHTIMSSDRMSPCLTQIKLQPPCFHLCTHLHPSSWDTPTPSLLIFDAPRKTYFGGCCCNKGAIFTHLKTLAKYNAVYFILF